MKIDIREHFYGLVENISTNRARSFIAVSVFVLIFFCYHFQSLQRFELVTYDYRCIAKGVRPTDPRIVVIEISDDSIARIGRWPWDRTWHAALIKILGESGAKAVAFDVIFSEKSEVRKDAALSMALKKAGNVYLAQIVEKNPRTGKNEVLKSLPQFTLRSRGGGHINLRPDIDGTMRRIPLALTVNGKIVPQLSLRLAMDEMGCTSKDLEVYDHKVIIRRPAKNPLVVPLDEHGNMILNWAGTWLDTFEHYSYIDIIRSYTMIQKGEKPLVDLGHLKGKICYVGTSATGLYDIRPTPLEPSYPAVGVNLHVLNNLLEEKFIKPMDYKQNIFILFLVMIAMFEIMKIRSYLRVALLIGILISGYIAIATILFIYTGIWINIVYSFSLILLTYFFVTIYNQLSISIEKSKLMKLATRDSLTGLFNIGHFKLLLKAEITTISLRREKKLSLVMGDVDNFKKTNDTYGHVTGDTVLREVATAVKNNCRALDVAARYGGEEFILMLPGADANEAFKIADKIRKAIEQKTFLNDKGDFHTSISIGVTQISPDDKDIEAVVGRADRALYEAKHTGKNKVVIASDSPKIA